MAQTSDVRLVHEWSKSEAVMERAVRLGVLVRSEIPSDQGFWGG